MAEEKIWRDRIKIWNGRIENAPAQLGVDAVVNAADPTLMGSDKFGVDRAIHTKVNELAGVKDFLKTTIKSDVDGVDFKEDRVIRCRRGEVYVSPGYDLCRYIFHTVGPKDDSMGEPGSKYCSSYTLKILENCYRNIILQAIEMPDIESIAFPVISSGNHGMEFETAFRVGLTTVYNTLLEKKIEDEEMFGLISLKKIYFVILCPTGEQKAKSILEEYWEIFDKDHRAVARCTAESQKELMCDLKLYDEKRGYFSLIRWFRIFLVWVGMYVFPLTRMKDWLGKRDWINRRQTVEWYALIKAVLPLLFLLAMHNSSWKYPLVSDGVILFTLYFQMETVIYLLSLMILADVQKPSANAIRSLFLLGINYIEMVFDISLIYYIMYHDRVNLHGAVSFGFFGTENFDLPLMSWPHTGILVLNSTIKFFYLSLAFGYFSVHLRQRRFREREK